MLLSILLHNLKNVLYSLVERKYFLWPGLKLIIIIIIIASEAEQSEASSQSEDSLRESERAPVYCVFKNRYLENYES